jgi:hypothetical protein
MIERRNPFVSTVKAIESWLKADLTLGESEESINVYNEGDDPDIGSYELPFVYLSKPEVRFDNNRWPRPQDRQVIKDEEAMTAIVQHPPLPWRLRVEIETNFTNPRADLTCCLYFARQRQIKHYLDIEYKTDHYDRVRMSWEQPSEVPSEGVLVRRFPIIIDIWVEPIGGDDYVLVDPSEAVHTMELTCQQ